MKDSVAESWMLFPVFDGVSTLLEQAHFYLIEAMELDLEELEDELEDEPAGSEVNQQSPRHFLTNAVIILVDVCIEGVVEELAGEMHWGREESNVAERELGSFRTEACEYLFDIFFPEPDSESEYKENYRLGSAMLYLHELRIMVLASLPDRVTEVLSTMKVKQKQPKRLGPP